MPPGRRRLLLALLHAPGVATAAWLGTPRPALAGARSTAAAAVVADGAAAMALAERLRAEAVAAGDQAFGAVVVRGGRVAGEGPSRVVTRADPTAHAEMEAIRDAARRLGTRDLRGCVLYSTSAPCAMCETAAYWAGIERLVHGASLDDAGRPRYGGC